MRSSLHPVPGSPVERAPAPGAFELLPTVEHEDLALPPGMLAPDGTLDLTDDVQSFVEVRYSRNRKAFTIRSSGWIGHIPLNERYALAVETKVPIANVERIVDRASFPPSAFRTLVERRRLYAGSVERPSSLLDVLAEGFLAAITDVRDEGLLKSYAERSHVGTSPAGRFDPMRSTVRTKTTGRPIAVSSRFERTLDNVPNRILRQAAVELARCYPSTHERRSRRGGRVADAMAWLPQVGPAHRDDVSVAGIDRHVRASSGLHAAYGPALTLAGHLLSGRGLSLLDRDGSASAPVALVNMDLIFEGYCRNVLRGWAPDGWRILDGNVDGEDGAKELLFTEVGIREAGASTAEPDIVIEKDGVTRMIIDAKYRKAAAVPSREVVNQLACYAARYGCDTVMALYPALPTGRQACVERIGEIGSLRVFRGTIDISRPDLAEAEDRFCEAVRQVAVG